MAAVLEWDGVTVRAGDTLILSDFSLSVEKGEQVLLYGPSGIGKSSILKSLLGFIPHDSGRMLCDGISFDTKTVWEIRRKIAYVPQASDIGEGPVRSIIDTVFSYKSNGEPPSRKRILELFALFQLSEEFLEKEFGELSGGEKQRVALIIGLLLERKILFLDEVTASLDGDLKRKVISHITSLADTTQCIVSHDPEWTKVGGIRIVDLTENRA